MSRFVLQLVDLMERETLKDGATEGGELLSPELVCCL